MSAEAIASALMTQGGQPRFDSIGRQHDDMMRLHTSHRSHRDRPIKGHQSPTVLYSQREQVDVGELFRAADMRVINQFRVEQRDVVGPEDMLVGSGVLPQMVQSSDYRNRRRMLRLRRRA